MIKRRDLLSICLSLLAFLMVSRALGEIATTLPAAAPAGIDAPLWASMKQVDARASAIADLTADFEQLKFTPLLKKPMTSSGTVLAKGNIMLWTTRVPEPTVMRVDETEIQVYYPTQKTVEIYPLSGRLAELASSPVPRLAALLDHFSFLPAPVEDLGEKSGPGRLALRMIPTDKTIAEHVARASVLIDSDRGFILALKMTDPDGEHTEIRFSNVRTNTNLDKARLMLTLPQGVKTVHPLEGVPSSNP